MKFGVAVAFACLVPMPAYAGPHDAPALPIKELLRPATRYSLSMGDGQTSSKPFQLAGGYVYESAFARAIARAAKRSPSELALEAATKIIVMCQKERNPALTTPFFRSDSQQAHCFRY